MSTERPCAKCHEAPRHVTRTGAVCSYCKPCKETYYRNREPVRNGTSLHKLADFYRPKQLNRGDGAKVGNIDEMVVTDYGTQYNSRFKGQKHRRIMNAESWHCDDPE